MAKQKVQAAPAKERAATRKEEDILERIKICNEYIRIWAEYSKPLLDELEDRQILPEEEKHYFKVIHALALNHYKFTNALGSLFKEGGGIISLISDIQSVNHLKTLSEAQLGRYQLDWHKIFLMMNKAEGKLISMIPLDSPVRREIQQIIAK